MDRIGIIGAMPEEVQLLKAKFEGVTVERTAGLEIYTGTLRGKTVSLCQSGMGKVAAGAATQLLITKYGVEGIIFSGIAGNMTSKIGIGDICLGREVVYHDAEIPMIKQHYPYLESYKGDEKMIAAAGKACREIGVKYIRGKIATGDKFIGDSRTKKRIARQCSPDCVEMEGAAVAHIAAKNDLPFLIIRAMSDDADEAVREKIDQKSFDIADYCDKAAQICRLTVKYC